ncbi:STAS/SEC14 domain-containing protein [Methanosarcina sp. MSH10X1]|uniref:STAS/SEC14 domain-containing protein n=1 Tax=Methanosarcina sp. MSH10X1 TaxID=2507075 RepID=UPI000FFC811D|nr:STAS/SEC14 domain-containing protein [Methanosarcina sp. MSH10X1]RXA19963.1 STAS/SEC14 domain-containing protein [Methanosarcina sp. MSH10X1]
MIEIIQGLPENVVAVHVSGEVTGEDYSKVLIPAVEDKIKKHGKIRMLYHLDRDLEWFTLNAILEDAKIGIRSFTAFEKIALVSDVDWMNSAVEMLKFVIPFPVKTYSNEELSEAKAWVSE